MLQPSPPAGLLNSVLPEHMLGVLDKINLLRCGHLPHSELAPYPMNIVHSGSNTSLSDGEG